jgi:hypothetical protein
MVTTYMSLLIIQKIFAYVKDKKFNLQTFEIVLNLKNMKLAWHDFQCFSSLKKNVKLGQ